MADSEDARLAGELRTTEWACDELANDLPAGRATPEQMRELAERLNGMAAILRVRAGTKVHREALEGGGAVREDAGDWVYGRTCRICGKLESLCGCGGK